MKQQRRESRLQKSYQQLCAYRTLSAAMIEIGKAPRIPFRVYLAMREDQDREAAFGELLKKARCTVIQLER